MNSFLTSLRRVFRQPNFVVAFILMGICAATLNTAASLIKLRWQKQAAPLRVNLKDGISPKLGHWVMVSKDQGIDPEIEQVLATREYVFRDYVDSSKISDAEITLIKEASSKDRDLHLSELQRNKPEAVIRMGLTYYTGLVDTVAHVPERCYVADGFEVKEYEEQPTTAGTYADGSPRQVNFRFVGFEDQTGMGASVDRVARNVGYVFNCNGSYTSSPFEVRGRLQNLFERYGYYAKIEIMTAAPLPVDFYRGNFEANNHDKSVAAMKDFLTEVLPDLEKCLPDWNALHQQSGASH